MIEWVNLPMYIGSFMLGCVVTAVILYSVVIKDLHEQVDEFIKFLMYDRNVGAATLTQSQHKFTNAIPAQHDVDKDKKMRESVYFKALADGYIDDAGLNILGQKDAVVGA